jgi:hypothetical protein
VASDQYAAERLRRLGIVVAGEREIAAAARTAVAALLKHIDGGAITAAASDQSDSRKAAIAFWLSSRGLTSIVRKILDIFTSRFARSSGTKVTPVEAARFGALLRESLQGIPDEIMNDLEIIKAEALKSGAGPEEIRKTLTAELTPGHAAYEHRLDVISTRIARTNSVAAFNAGEQAGHTALAERTGHTYTKRWLSSHDQKVRPTHVEADEDPDNQEVPADGTFSVGGFPALYPGDPTLPPQESENCRCTVLYSLSTEAPIVAATLGTDEGDAIMTTPEPGLPDGWRGAICALDVPTSDGRMAATPPGGVRTRAYPLTLTRNHVGDPTGYPTIGSIDHVWVDPETNLLMGEGKIDIGGDEGADYARQLASGMLNRMSIDPVEVKAEMRVFDADGNQLDTPAGGWSAETFAALPDGAVPVTTFTDWTLAGLAAVPIPAYSQAAVEPVYGYTPSGPYPTDAIVAAVVAATPANGMSSVDANFLGQVVRHAHRANGIASRYLASPSASSSKARDIAANIHKGSATMITDATIAMATSGYSGQMPLVASVGGQVFNAKFFTNPNLTGPTKLTVTEDGHIYGHVRLHGTCYQYGGGAGDGGYCVQPPPSACGYAKYMCHSAKLDDGRTIDVGAMTFGDGHESRGSLYASKRHYNDVATTAAKISVGDDEFGVWVSGQVVDAYADRAYDLLLSPLSGHWEPDADNNGYLELMAVHIVVTPGYSVRGIVASFDDEGRTTSLIITTVPEPEEPIVAAFDPTELDAAIEAALTRREASALAAQVAAQAERKAAMASGAQVARDLGRIFNAPIVAAGGDSIADPGTAWDGPGAASRALDAATKNGKINVGEAGKSFLAHVGDGSKRGDWKLPYRDGGRIIPRGVSAAAGRVGQTQGIDQGAAKSKIAGLYSQIHAKFPMWPDSPPA